jgi:energy-coupling factor transport system substrate-specific component
MQPGPTHPQARAPTEAISVSWQVGAFGILALALGAGFAWYERARPDARIIALVGTLAALAALGRIAFAAVPNVKPTTDIVLISGYALGGGPGFAVGAIGGLASNFFFGQGPWTPWQMAAWGATGVLGAGLARTRLLRGGRWGLAIVCCAAGFAFTAFQDVGDWVTFSDHSWAQLVVYVGQGLGFDAIHAAACLVFALAFGPALTRSIQRFARRLEVTWLPAAPLAAGLLALVLAGAGAASVPSRAQAADGPAGYLLGAQNSDGGFGISAGQPSNQLYAGWAALGLASAGYDLNHVAHGGASVIDYVRSGAGSADPGSLERTILVARAAGQSARTFGGHDLIAELLHHVDVNGSVSGQVNLTAFAVLALRSDGVTPPARTLGWLERQQGRDGGFSFAGAGGSSDPDDTGATLEALAGAGGRARTVRARAVAYLRLQQDGDGGFASQPEGGSNAQSTAWAIQGLEAAGVNPDGLRRHGARSPVAYLRSLIGPSGRVAYARGNSQTPVWVTGEALMALEGKPLPLVVAPAPRSAPAAAQSITSTASATTPAPATHGDRPRHQHHTARHVAAQHRRAAADSAPVPARSAETGRLAAAVGVLTALVLAPVGAG